MTAGAHSPLNNTQTSPLEKFKKTLFKKFKKRLRTASAQD